MDKTTLFISGIEVHVYGLKRVQRDAAKEVDVVFVLHGRTQSFSDYEEAAYTILAKSYSTSDNTHHGRGLLVVLFDQRNHGHRKVSEVANLTWTDLPTPNPRHAQDMFSIYYGTAHDTSLLITFLPHFLFPPGSTSPSPRIVNHICTGISLGGHATYCVLSDDPRVGAGVVVIGCPDFRAMMTQRAAMSTTTTTQGQDPDSTTTAAAASAVAAIDGGANANNLEKEEQPLLPPAFMSMVDKLGPDAKKVAEKDLLILRGDQDMLVPWSASEDWVSQLPKGRVEVVGYPGVGHAFTDGMKEKMAGWIDEWRRKH